MMTLIMIYNNQYVIANALKLPLVSLIQAVAIAN